MSKYIVRISKIRDFVGWSGYEEKQAVVTLVTLLSMNTIPCSLHQYLKTATTLTHYVTMAHLSGSEISLF
jgi:hypothetical protein